ncbi:MAG: hypothetical protein LBP22_13065 [Deltaproteobacteria bacterium]|jgi:outer membrane biosynthesis protein TonB|nr:hypothetical protein [Deltaproteobacteria bacterium]
MSVPDRDDDRPGGDDTFDIEIEGFDNLNFHEEEQPEAAYENPEMDLELERIIRRLDEVTAPVPPAPQVLEVEAEEPDPESIPPPPIPRPPQVPRAVKPSAQPQKVVPPPTERPGQGLRNQPAARPLQATAPEAQESPPQTDSGTILLTERLAGEEAPAEAGAILGLSLPGEGTVAQMTPLELAELIEKAVEKGFRRALAAQKAKS